MIYNKSKGRYKIKLETETAKNQKMTHMIYGLNILKAIKTIISVKLRFFGFF